MKKTVLITGARAPVALHMTRLLAGADLRVLLADNLRAPLAEASGLHSGYFRVPSFVTDREAAGLALSEILDENSVDLVVPTCEEVLHLAAYWEVNRPSARLIAPALSTLEQVHNKHRFIEVCDSAGLAVPETRLLQSADDLAAIAPEAPRLVFKPVWSRFGASALRRPIPRLLKRITPTATAPWVAQDFIEGDEVSLYAVAVEGRVTALSAYRGLLRAGAGAAVAFAPVDVVPLMPLVEAITRATNWTGQISFDFIRSADGTFFPIECNPRATSGFHFFKDGPAFARAMFDGQPNAPNVTRAQGVRLAAAIYGPWFRVGGDELRGLEDVIHWPEDPVGLGPQLRSIAEFAGIALRHRIGLQRATTFDIEWNGSGEGT